jgi:hypothetical protein
MAVDHRSSVARRTRRAERQARVKQQRERVLWIGVGAIVLVLGAMLSAKLLLSNQAAATGAGVPSADVLQAVTQVPPERLQAVGSGSVSGYPVRIPSAMARDANGLPEITYVGAEYCPFCAGERWGMIIALSRFGTFSNLHTTTSAADDVYPSTPTFTFYGSSYSSPYLDFSSVELQSNVRAGGQYRTLQTPTSAQQQLLNAYDAPPYVPSGSAGSIPFIDFANQYVVSGASYDVGVLQGRTWQTVAANLSDTSSDQAKGILGTANVLTAALCTTTANTPAEVCGTPTMSELETKLSAQ